MNGQSQPQGEKKKKGKKKKEKGKKEKQLAPLTGPLPNAIPPIRGPQAPLGKLISLYVINTNKKQELLINRTEKDLSFCNLIFITRLDKVLFQWSCLKEGVKVYHMLAYRSFKNKK